ncbi:homodimeric dihydroxyacetone kinase [Micromonospora pallida]|uniref:Homodimeric dihydroxyacetone kinase n=1 Tax=Micromonospora pallida TaxID=145854 RepID=A0A1C6SHN4_9ACTN|nr:dihydroxyacetone kinase family protein [Micromonospora pallida]SCL28935.1 homodimeric dihydroxyacetone kinase [Micromonospora pallida]
MTRLYNDPSAFADEMIEGFAAASGRWVRPVAGGVVRRRRPRTATVAVVVGGGSGHYPAFGGLVGPGLAHGAAMGNLFASPSAQQVYSVAKQANTGAGVLLTYGNYAGDVLHFDQAQERLIAEGIPCRTVLVTDDISSATADQRDQRRGIAGDLVVFKAAAAAAEAGYSLDEVARVAGHANHQTRSFGVAFTGCTLPGADTPLFTVPEGRMAVGMGIHGEPGINEQDVPTADQLAELLVTALLDEVPDGVGEIAGSRVAVILNGLGSVKYEELFVVYRRVAQLLTAAGVDVVEPDVGEFVTSFDMAGVSLTLTWLDDELERFWRAPADTPAYRKGPIGYAHPGDGPTAGAAATGEEPDGLVEVDPDGAIGEGPDGPAGTDPDAAAGPVIPAATADSQRAGQLVCAVLRAVRTTIDRHADELGRIDAVAGDGDHGIGMQRGAGAASLAAEEAGEQGAGVRTVLTRAADAWADRAGGTSGALWGAALRAMAETFNDASAPSGTDVATAVQQAAQAIVRYGKAELGDKTMVDALLPFSTALRHAVDDGLPLGDAWQRATAVAQAAADDTASLLPRKGRARPHAEKSLGTPDAGAVSLALVVAAVHTALVDQA